MDAPSGSDTPLVSNEVLQAFIVESDQLLQDVVSEIHSRHYKFINIMVERMSTFLPLATQTNEEAASRSKFGYASSLPPSSRTSPAASTPSEVVMVEAFKESVASLLSPIQSDLKCMVTAITDIQASSDRLEKSSAENLGIASRIAFSDSSKRDLGNGVEQVHRWEAFRTLTRNAGQLTKTDSNSIDLLTPEEAAESLGFGNTSTAKSSLNFAADMLLSLSTHEAVDLFKMLHTCELPYYRQDEGCCGQSEPERKSRLASVLKSNCFQHGISLVIVLNAVFITFCANYAVSHPEYLSSWSISVLEVTFNTFYVVEIVLKLCVHGRYFFLNEDFKWNNFNTILVVGALYDLIMTHLGMSWDSEPSTSANDYFGLTFFRILWLLRLAKVIRIFRVMRIFSELRVLAKVMRSILQPLFWCSFTLAVCFYTFAVIFTYGTASHLLKPDTDLQSVETKQLLDDFGSVWLSMISLYKATTGGADWGDVAEPLHRCHPIYYGLFMFFIAFIILALLNVLTGLFVDRAMRAVAEDKDGRAIAKVQSDRAVVEDLCRIFCTMSGEAADKDAKIGQDHFQDFMHSPVLRACMANLDLEIWDSANFFKMLTSISQTSELNMATFVSGCMQLRGSATCVDLQVVLSEVRSVKQHVKAAQHFQYELGRHLLGGAPQTILL